jgi:hypothetical protein
MKISETPEYIDGNDNDDFNIEKLSDIREIHQSIIRKSIMLTLLHPTISSVVKMEVWNRYSKPESIGIGNISAGGLWNDWNINI